MKQEKPEDLGYGCKGHGTVVWDRNREQNNGYLNVAHIAENGRSITFREPLSEEAKKEIERFAFDEYLRNPENVPVANQSPFAVIVRTQVDEKRLIFGVQYWKPEWIDKGQSTNTDNTVSNFMQLVRPILKGQGENKVSLYDKGEQFTKSFVVAAGQALIDYFPTFSGALEYFEAY